MSITTLPKWPPACISASASARPASGKRLVDHRLQLRHLDGADHLLHVLAAADGDAVDVQVAAEDRCDVEVLHEAGQHPDHRDGAAERAGGDRLLEGARAADLDHVVDAAPAGELARRGRPSGVAR